MKKTYTIHLSATVFYIEDDAYEELQKYLISLKKYFGDSEEGREIIADIEFRIAEIFTSKITEEKKVVTMDWVNEVVEMMGTPETFNEAGDNEEPFGEKSRRKRRLYRDPEHKVLGGVCGGLAAYFDIDPVVMRLIMVLLFFFTGIALFVYLILWIVVPKAVNAAQRLEMRGEDVTVKNIEKFIKEEVDSVKESYNKFKKEGFFSKSKA
ncbi:PspC domain-containing protein [Maribellus comscasis]|uniref:PspC domain-containing protein n=1 Tax=Maribellus comscasis TaxID=2681766 RepID=A0A6I6K6E1_9BACT|nr:PspC domain-containing protein [Maribellus comscasis]QGY45564.1 PspC domain-containing protein [Maribellus comscasis]